MMHNAKVVEHPCQKSLHIPSIDHISATTVARAKSVHPNRASKLTPKHKSNTTRRGRVRLRSQSANDPSQHTGAILTQAKAVG